MIRKHLSKTGIFKRKLNKFTLEIIRNLELMCFIKRIKIKAFQNIILNKLSEKNELKTFINYLKNFIFKLKYSNYNYEDIIKFYKNKNNLSNNDKNKILEKLYLTNNLVESINGKIAYYLPKKPINNIAFVNTISKLLINSEFADKDIIRHDLVTKTLILIIEKLNFNDNLKLITFSDYKKFNEEIIYKFKPNLNNDETLNLFKSINELEDEKKDDEINLII